LEAKYSEIIQVRCAFPLDIPAGPTTLRVRWARDRQTALIPLQIPPLKAQKPVIHLISNGEDSGTDIYARGPKSLVRLLIMGPPQDTKMEGVEVELNGSRLRPQKLTYLPAHASWEVMVQLPPATASGQSEFSFSVGALCSLPLRAIIREV
jgi:hypothetical protein